MVCAIVHAQMPNCLRKFRFTLSMAPSVMQIPLCTSIQVKLITYIHLFAKEAPVVYVDWISYQQSPNTLCRPNTFYCRYLPYILTILFGLCYYITLIMQIVLKSDFKAIYRPRCNSDLQYQLITSIYGLNIIIINVLTMLILT